MLRFACLLPLLSTAPLLAQDPAGLESPAQRFDDWEDRDAEGRWALVAEDLQRDPDRLTAWVQQASVTSQWRRRASSRGSAPTSERRRRVAASVSVASGRRSRRLRSDAWKVASSRSCLSRK